MHKCRKSWISLSQTFALWTAIFFINFLHSWKRDVFDILINKGRYSKFCTGNFWWVGRWWYTCKLINPKRMMMPMRLKVFGEEPAVTRICREKIDFDNFTWLHRASCRCSSVNRRNIPEQIHMTNKPPQKISITSDSVCENYSRRNSRL